MLPIEINVRSAGVSQEDKIFYTNDDGETEEQYWAKKEAIRKNPAKAELAITIQAVSTNLKKTQPEIQVRLRKTNQITIEQSKDSVLQQLKAKNSLMRNIQKTYCNKIIDIDSTLTI